MQGSVLHRTARTSTSGTPAEQAHHDALGGCLGVLSELRAVQCGGVLHPQPLAPFEVRCLQAAAAGRASGWWWAELS